MTDLFPSAPLPSNSCRLPRALRLQHALEYGRVYNSKLFAADSVLVVNGCVNGLQVSRLGLSLSRAVGKAVVRNRWKRLIREAFRQNRTKLPMGYDFVVRPKRGAEPEFAAVCSSLPRLAALVAKRSAAIPS